MGTRAALVFGGRSRIVVGLFRSTVSTWGFDVDTVQGDRNDPRLERFGIGDEEGIALSGEEGLCGDSGFFVGNLKGFQNIEVPVEKVNEHIAICATLLGTLHMGDREVFIVELEEALGPKRVTIGDPAGDDPTFGAEVRGEVLETELGIAWSADKYGEKTAGG